MGRYVVKIVVGAAAVAAASAVVFVLVAGAASPKQTASVTLTGTSFGGQCGLTASYQWNGWTSATRMVLFIVGDTDPAGTSTATSATRGIAPSGAAGLDASATSDTYHAHGFLDDKNGNLVPGTEFISDPFTC